MGIFKRGKFYWYEFVFDEKRIRQSTQQGDKQTAKTLMAAERSRLARVKAGLERDVPKGNPTIGELLNALQEDFERRCIWDKKNQSNFRAARAAFPETLKASALGVDDVERYIDKRQKEGIAPATINRAVGLVSQSFKKAIADKKIDRDHAPKFPHLSEAGNARKGFFEADEFARLLEHLPEDLTDFCKFAYITGWRKSEIGSLTWSDIEGDVVRLRGENAKNGESRSVVLTGELAKIIERRRQDRLVDGTLTRFVFHRDGQRVAEFRKSWAAACVAAGLGTLACPKCGESGKEGERTVCVKCETRRGYTGKIFHDFRRTAVRDMIRSGVPQSIAMRISGHKTASMFRRYDITSEDDLRTALLAVERYRETEKAKVVKMGSNR